MIRKLAFTIGLVITTAAAFSQSGRLSGKVTDKETKEALPFATVIIFQNGVQKSVVQTDFDGNYVIAPLDAGKYDLQITYIGYDTKLLQGIIITSNLSQRQNVEMFPEGKQIKGIEIIAEKLVELDKTTTGGKLSSEDIVKAPTRDFGSLVATQGNIAQKDDGQGFNIAGNREGNTQVIINGVKYNSSSLPNLPTQAIQELQVITGGVPAQFGDVTGGVINITTKVGANKINGGIEAESGAMFDQWNQSLVGFNLSGPIIARETGDTSNPLLAKETILGFFFSSQFQHARDPKPSAIGIYQVKEDALREVTENPLVPFGDGYAYSAERLTLDDLYISKVRPNSARQSAQLNGSLEFYPTENITVSAGGFLNYNRYHDYVFNYGLFNSSNNPLYTTWDYSGFLRYRQTFGNAKKEDESASALNISNAYYQVQMDYVARKFRYEDDTHGDKLFRYGHVGTFTPDQYGELINETEFDGTSYLYYTKSGNDAVVRTIFGDSVTTIEDATGNIYSNANSDGFNNVRFTPSEYNPEAGRYLEHYLELSGRDRIDNVFDLVSQGLFINGGRARPVHDLWYGAGREYNGYGLESEEQYRLSGLVSGDLGKHNLMFGFEYEQRVRTNYNISPLTLWFSALANTNNHIIDIDLENPIITSDTANYVNFNYVTDMTLQTNFDKSLREKLGVADDEMINVFALNPDDMDISYFTAGDMMDLVRFGQLDYRGYDHTGKKLKTNPTFEDFFLDTINRPQAAFRPIYTSFFLQDKFEISDLIVRLGLRVDRYDANQTTLKDRYSTVKTNTVAETDMNIFANSSSINTSTLDEDWVVYVDKDAKDFNGGNQNTYNVVGFREGDRWYNLDGDQVRSPRFLTQSSVMNPWFDYAPTLDANSIEGRLFRTNQLTLNAFEDYRPQWNVLPRVSFSFPVNDMATFFANYDVLTQRPDPNRNRVYPSEFYFLNQSGFVNNSNLRPQRNIKYQLGFKQALDAQQTVALTIETFYQEIKDQVQLTAVEFAYPASYQTFGNLDFGTVKGGVLTIDTRRVSNIKLNASYTLSFAEGTGSDPTTVRNIVNLVGNLKVPTPLDFDQRHAFKINADYRLDSAKGPVIFGKKLFQSTGANMIFNFGSGNPYTKLTVARENNLRISQVQRTRMEGSINGSNLPWNFRTSLRIYKDFYIGKKNKPLNVYLYVQNLFNTRNVIDVYKNTGSPDDDGYLSRQLGESQEFLDMYVALLNNPAFYSQPRRARLGIAYYF